MNRILVSLIGAMLAIAPPALAADSWGDLLTVREDRAEIRREASEIAREDHALHHQLRAGNSWAAARDHQLISRESNDLAHARARLDRDEQEIARRHIKRRS